MEKTASPTFIDSTIGKKVVMAVTGVVLYGFVLSHMLGNLQIYLGAEALNSYAASLHTMLHGGGIWIARSVLLASVALHIWTAFSLTLRNRGARKQRYKVYEPRASTYASRTMAYSGPILLFFILFHLSHLTLGTTHPNFVEGDVYQNVVLGFQQPLASAFYIIAMVLLGLHMRHGLMSLLQTTGLSHPRWNGLRAMVSTGIAVLVVLGNISFPVAVLTGVIR
jgi:succinate dehydrogenase / fumarate reductase, cytochrome b subunit